MVGLIEGVYKNEDSIPQKELRDNKGGGVWLVCQILHTRVFEMDGPLRETNSQGVLRWVFHGISEPIRETEPEHETS